MSPHKIVLSYFWSELSALVEIQMKTLNLET